MKTIFITLSTIISVLSAYSQESKLVDLVLTIDSEALNEKREIWVGLPNNFDPERKYPTLYVMDAEWQFEIAFAVTKELAANDKVPKHIVIGIPNVDNMTRTRDLTFTDSKFNSEGELDSLAAFYFSSDFTGGGNAFFSHLTQEVVPLVNNTYRTNGFDVFVGHSLSGYFGAYMIQMDSPFNAFQLYDPSIWYNQGAVIQQLSNSTQKLKAGNIFISTANGGKDRAQYNVDTHAQFQSALREKGVDAHLGVYKEDHGSVRLVSLIDGLSGLYDGYAIGYISATDQITVQDAIEHYKTFSEKVDYRFDPQVDVFRWIGFANHHQGKWENAIEAYERCEVLYDADVMMMLEFADSYYQLQKFDLSKSLYKQVLSIDPQNETALQRINELE